MPPSYPMTSGAVLFHREPVGWKIHRMSQRDVLECLAPASAPVHISKNDPKSMTAERWKLYEQLWQGKKPFQGSPYLAVPFDQPLSKEVITNEYGILPEYQKYYNYG